jgi:3-methyladenine DNA glycosylase AlkD
VDITQLRAEMEAASSPERAASSTRFFKTGPGGYDEGDTFIGVPVPVLRKIAKQYHKLSLTDLEELLASPIHEERLIALIIMVYQYGRGDEPARRTIYNFYIANTGLINNWDLVDSSAEFIVGPWLQDRDKSVLRKLATSPIVWDRRIAMLATFHYIKAGNPQEALTIAEILVHDQHDLIQKAVGWMLREIGKRCSIEAEEEFLKKHYKTMPRTMLRYAIERFPPKSRQQYQKAS